MICIIPSQLVTADDITTYYSLCCSILKSPCIHLLSYHHLQLIFPPMFTLTNHVFLFFNDPPTTEIYTLSLHDALPIWQQVLQVGLEPLLRRVAGALVRELPALGGQARPLGHQLDRLHELVDVAGVAIHHRPGQEIGRAHV